MAEFTIRVSDNDVELLRQLVGEGFEWVASDVAGLIEHLARSAADGVRRPGSWERNWITQATGWAG